MERHGIAVAGTTLVDKIYDIQSYPEIGELTKILKVSTAVGGCVPNVAVDLKKIAPMLDIYAACKIGDDKEGEFVVSTLRENGVDVSAVKTASGMKTSFTDVMSVVGGQRTFFTYAGADSDFGVDDIDFDSLEAKILHLGYFLLLDKVDNGEGVEILKKASEKGIKTSIDLVSENSDRYSVVLPCLKYTDYLIINETEAGNIAGLEPTSDNLETIARRLKDAGVREKVIIHMPDRAVCLSDEGYTVSGSVEVPKSYIKGKTGAGDAFCAGALVGIYNGLCDADILDLASCTAAVSLGAPDATSGLKTAAECISFCADYKRLEI